MLADCHVHSEFSSDSETPVTDMLNRAVACGMKYFYLTDHHDIDFPVDAENGMDFQLDTPSYLTRIAELTDQYREQITVRTGVELGLMAHIADKLETYVSDYNFDFIIGSSHLVRGMDPYYPSYYEGRSQTEAYREYFESIYENTKTFQNYDVYGHLDYVVRYGPTKNQNYTYQKHADIIDRILRAIVESGKGIELNTSGFRSGLGQPNPCVDILKRYKELGGEIITVGSDAHKPEHVGADFDKACTILKNCGFQYYTIFEKRTPEFIKL